MKLFQAILIFIAFTSCGHVSSPEKESHEITATAESLVRLTDAQSKNAKIETGKLIDKSISSVLNVNGTIDVPPQNIVSISVPLGGYLRSSRLIPGMHVVKGQTIAVMEDPQYIQLQQDYLTSRAKLAYAEQEYLRQKELNLSKASSDKIFQQAEAEYHSQEILARSLSEKLKLINIDPGKLAAQNISRSIAIPSPIDGFVSRVNANIGKYTSPSEALFEIIDPSDIHLSLNIFEKDVDKVFIGQQLVAYTNGNPEKKYRCEVILISKNYSGDRTVQVHCHFLNYDKSLIPGTFMNAQIILKNVNVPSVPADAVVHYGNSDYIFIQRDRNLFEMKKVAIGSTQNDLVEITRESATMLGDKPVVVKGAYSLLMKLKNTSEE